MKMCYDCGAQNSLQVTTQTRPYLPESGLHLEVEQTIYTCSSALPTATRGAVMP